MTRRKSTDERKEIVVFSIVRESSCSECGSELWKGDFLRMEERRPFCLTCADLDYLVFLASGDAALTRRAGKHSTLRAVVVRFSRARKRYERQGILVEEAALEQAEQECLADADARELARHACAKHSGRVGRSASAKQFEASAVDLAVRAHVRHTHTSYDEFLALGSDRLGPRDRVAPRVDGIIAAWLPQPGGGSGLTG